MESQAPPPQDVIEDDEDQASLGPGVQVWVTHPTEGFQTAVIVREESGGTSFVVRTDDDGHESTLAADAIWLRNPAILEGVDDLTKLSYMHEAAILHNLHVRYMISQIYTYTGPILIAVNPYQRLPLYSKQMISQYCGQPLGKLSPHVYAIAEDAFRAMLTERRSQSILVSGESGAGKTETTKFLLQYFAAMGEENKGEGNVHNQVLQSTPLLEAFGNAKTLRNDNSSRFGKFIEIQFDRSGNIAGASIHTYLLEKSRIVRQQLGERGYHVFYQLLAGITDDERAELRLGSPSDYHYVNQSDCTEIEGVSDRDTFQKTRKAMTVVGISDERQREIFKLLAAVLHLGNWKKGGADAPIETACELLQCDFEQMKKSLLQRKMVAGREVYFVDMDDEQAEGARDSLAMLLYSRLFDWLVVALNDNIQRNKKAATLREGEEEVFIGVLDIYGFESFEVNSFEQFCINYANEKLQQQFNQHIFKHEQQEYLKEKLDWSYINFNDNQECLDLIEQKPLGILSLLDEECRFPKASASTFALKLKTNHAKNKYFSSDRFAESSFTVSHYAGRVTYDTGTFLDKNKDYIIEDQVKVMLESKSEFVREVFKAPKAPAAPSGPATGRAGGRDGGGSSSFKFVSVAAQFRESLASLMSTINKTTPHYVRCIKPNPQKKPALFDKPQVLHQLRCGGVLESVRISMAGYPGRHSYDQFYKRYRVLAPSAGKTAAEPQDACMELVAALGLNKRHYQFGLTKLFLKGGQIAVLERRRGEKLNEAALRIQKTWRGHKDFRRYRDIHRAVVRLQTFARSVVAKAKLRVLRENAAATTLQACARRFLARTRFVRQRQALVYVQRVFVAKREKRTLRAARREKAAVTLQAQTRGLLQRRAFQRHRHAVVAAQSLWRRKVAKRELAELKKEARQLSTVVAAKAALEDKVQELEWRLSAEAKVKKKAEKEAARLREELDELRRAAREARSADERRARDEDEARGRREREERERARVHDRELEDLRARLAEAAARNDALEAELEALRAANAQARDAAGQREADEARGLREENERLRDLMRQMEQKMEDEEERHEATVLDLRRELEKLRIRSGSPLSKPDRMETLQKRINDFSSVRNLSGEGLPTRTLSSHHAQRATAVEQRRVASSGDGIARAGPGVGAVVADQLYSSGGATQLVRVRSDLQANSKRPRSQTSSSRRQLAFEPHGAADVSSAKADEQEKEAEQQRKKREEREAFMKRIERDIDEEKAKARELEERRLRKEEELRQLRLANAAAAAAVEDAADVSIAHPAAKAAAVKEKPKPKGKDQEKAKPAAPAAAVPRQHSKEAAELSDKAKKRREIEQDLIEQLRKKYRAGADQELSLVGLENEAIMTLLPDPSDATSQQLIRFLMRELEPGFVSGVPAPALVLHGLFNHWGIYAAAGAQQQEQQQEAHSAAAPEVFALIVEELYGAVRRSTGDVDLLMYWLSNTCTLFHLVSAKLKELRRAAAAEGRRKGAELDDDSPSSSEADKEEDDEEEEEEAELYRVTSFDDFDEADAFAQVPHASLRRSVTSAAALKRQLSELVTKLYTLLLKRAYADLNDRLHECILGKAASSSASLAASPQRAMNTIQPVMEMLSRYLLGLVQNFVFLSLVQKFFVQVFYFINATLFNEILLVRQLCTVDKAVDIKMHLASLENWVVEEGGLWLENAKVQLEPLHEIITLLMMPKKLIISSEELRREVIPRLNSLQVKQVLAMYTPTDMEERVSMADIQKMDRDIAAARRASAAASGGGGGADNEADESLLLETSHVIALSPKELHYLELNDAGNIPFPAEVKQKVHELVEDDILRRMSMAQEVIKQTKGGGSVLRSLVEGHHHHRHQEEEEEEGEDDVADQQQQQHGKEQQEEVRPLGRRRTSSKEDSSGAISPRGSDDPQKKSHFWSSFFGKE